MKKLNLKKKIVSQLTHNQLNDVRGGASELLNSCGCQESREYCTNDDHCATDGGMGECDA